MPQADFLLVHAGQLLTLSGPSGPRRGGQASELSVIADGALASMNGRIVWVGGSDSAVEAVALTPDAEVLDASGRVVAPGFVDSHTHPLFAGSRAAEFGQRAAGATYEEILRSGGGIASTVRATRLASREEISGNLSAVLRRMLLHGTTTVEAKSGYGLDMDTELACLEVLSEASATLPQTIVPTFMGPHAVPSDFPGGADGYLDFMIEEVLPVVASRKLASFADIFCERGAFDADQSRRFLTAARDMGLEPRIHADELSECGGALVASEVGARSADHLLQTSDEGLGALAASGTIATLLPGTAFFLGKDFPDARRFLSAGVPVALATDFNPGSCFTES
ncbi:imidazolonepropionase, partial [Candidatus Fermentibacteria bacterium]|nr:imidazolonepropionase [Candidatus Fermentibacteria bacterium]